MKPHAAILATVTTVCLSTASAFGQSGEDEELARCRALENNDTRLVCYDKLADMRMRIMASAKSKVPGDVAPTRTAVRPETPVTEPAKTPAPRRGRQETAVAAAKTEAQKRTEEFGSESVARNNPKIKKQRKKEQAGRIEAQVLEILFTVNGKARYILDNGQSWQQTDTAIIRRWKVPFKVIIKRASLGSYKLSKAGNNVSVRVKRIK